MGLRNPFYEALYILKILAPDLTKYSIVDFLCSNSARVRPMEMLPNVQRTHLTFDVSLAIRNANCLSLVTKIAAPFPTHQSKISESVASAARTSRTQTHSKAVKISAMRGGRLLSRRMSLMTSCESRRNIQHLRCIFERGEDFLFCQFRKSFHDRIDAVSG